MGTYRKAAARQAADTELLQGPPLGEGEWIRYWAVLPHSSEAAIASEATHGVVDRTMQVAATWDPGKATIARVRHGIVDWHLLDETGEEVPWNPKDSSLLDGLPADVFSELAERIDSRRMARRLTEPSDNGVERSEPLGEASDDS